MRILVVTQSYPPILGGLQTAVHSLAKEWQAAGHEVMVVTNRYPRQLPANEVLDNIQVKRLLFLYPDWSLMRKKQIDLLLASLLYYPLVRNQLGKIIKRFQPALVNLHFPDEQIPHILALHKRLKFRLVVSFHGHDIQRWIEGESQKKNGYYPTARDRLVKLLLEADRVTACSQHLLGQAATLEPSILQKGQAIHNGIDIKRFDDHQRYPHLKPYLFAWGRLTHIKGFDLLIEAFRKVSVEYPELDLIIAGTGNERVRLGEQTKQSHLDERVIFFGQANPEQVVQLLNGCRLAVIPSRQESFGITALEAMAAGKPVLATRVGGIPEFLPEEGNQLVKPAVEELETGLKSLLSNSKNLLNVPGNRQRAAQLTWHTSAQKYLDVFTN